MGLDMHLYRKTYVQNWDHYKGEKEGVLDPMTREYLAIVG